jgi:hypothetical protein
LHEKIEYVTGLRSRRRPHGATQHDGRTCSHIFFPSLHDYHKIPAFFLPRCSLLNRNRPKFIYTSA